MTSLWYFLIILIKVSPNNEKLDNLKIYRKRAVEKWPILNFLTPRKPRNSKNKSGTCFAGHPVVTVPFRSSIMIPWEVVKMSWQNQTFYNNKKRTKIRLIYAKKSDSGPWSTKSDLIGGTKKGSSNVFKVLVEAFFSHIQVQLNRNHSVRGQMKRNDLANWQYLCETGISGKTGLSR